MGVVSTPTRLGHDDDLVWVPMVLHIHLTDRLDKATPLLVDIIESPQLFNVSAWGQIQFYHHNMAAVCRYWAHNGGKQIEFSRKLNRGKQRLQISWTRCEAPDIWT